MTGTVAVVTGTVAILLLVHSVGERQEKIGSYETQVILPTVKRKEEGMNPLNYASLEASKRLRDAGALNWWPIGG